MINLLPPERAAQIRFSRSNSSLKHWLVAIAAATVGLVIIIVSGLVYLNQQSENLQSDIATSQQQLASGNLGQVESGVKTISSDVKLINQVLGREIRFSDLMQQIGKVMPSGTILSSLTLTNLSGAMDVTASTADYPSAAQIAINLSDPSNNLFTSVDIVNITCGQTSGISIYPCTATYRALFSKAAISRFLSVAKGSNQ